MCSASAANVASEIVRRRRPTGRRCRCRGRSGRGRRPPGRTLRTPWAPASATAPAMELFKAARTTCAAAVVEAAFALRPVQTRFVPSPESPVSSASLRGGRNRLVVVQDGHSPGVRCDLLRSPRQDCCAHGRGRRRPVRRHRRRSGRTPSRGRGSCRAPGPARCSRHSPKWMSSAPSWSRTSRAGCVVSRERRSRHRGFELVVAGVDTGRRADVLSAAVGHGTADGELVADEAAVGRADRHV